MTRLPLINTLWVLIAVVFLAAQTSTLAHATTYGDADHTHEGVACDVALVVAEHVVATPPVDVPVLVPMDSLETQTASLQPMPAQGFTVRAPPPRAPPLSFKA